MTKTVKWRGLTLTVLPTDRLARTRHVRGGPPRATFDPNKVGTLVVRRKDGRYEVVSGVRRHCHAELAGVADLPCVVLPDMSDAAAADVAFDVECAPGRRHLAPPDRFRLAYNARRPEAVAIHDAVRAAGFHVRLHAAEPCWPKTINSIRGLEYCYAVGGKAAVRSVLEYLKAAFWTNPLTGDPEAGVLGFEFLVGTATLLRERPAADPAAVRGKKASASVLLAEARRAAGPDHGGGRCRVAAAHELARLLHGFYGGRKRRP